MSNYKWSEFGKFASKPKPDQYGTTSSFYFRIGSSNYEPILQFVNHYQAYNLDQNANPSILIWDLIELVDPTKAVNLYASNWWSYISTFCSSVLSHHRFVKGMDIYSLTFWYIAVSNKISSKSLYSTTVSPISFSLCWGHKTLPL